MSVHHRLELDRWTSEFPLARLRAEARDYVLQRRQELPQAYADENAIDAHIRLMEPDWRIVVGPATVAINEQLKAEWLDGGEVPQGRVPTDLFVWAKGEAPDRSLTKIGGLPYRPADVPWPTGDTGEPLRFIVQLNFLDSRDLVPPLPGDVLLVFGHEDALVVHPERLVFEWWSTPLRSLVTEGPAVDDELAPYYAVLHRTDDWDDAIYEGTKIGGLPSFIQEEPDVRGAFIGTIGSISVAVNARYPFINHPEPRGWSRENDLMIGDMGSLYLFIDDTGIIQANSQCY